MATTRVLASALQLGADKMNYSSIKLASKAREAEEKRQQERKRALQVLVHHYLEEEGYVESARTFHKEARLSDHVVICDNIDLSTVIHEYEVYYNLRFQKLPKIFKQIDQSSSLISSILPKKNKKKSVTTLSNSSTLTSQGITAHVDLGSEECQVGELSVQSIPILPKYLEAEESKANKPLKPLGAFEGFSDEWKQFAEVISQEVIEKDLCVTWEDVIGVEDAKRLLKEAVVYPIKYPELFNGILSPWKGILLYGPPGTGKTLLAKAVASECKTTFFNISASSIVSKWRGDSEKLVRVMFEMARLNSPSTIFLDEIDALVSKRGCKSEHEASRRLKTEILIQLDGLSQGNDQIFFLANSNLPWELDPAMLRRLEKRILVDAPDIDAREKLFQYYMPPVVMNKPLMTSDVDYNTLAKESQYYTGSDIKIVCKEAAMNVMRKVFDVLDHNNKNSLQSDTVQLEVITTENVIEAMEKTKPLTVKFILQYRNWQSECGSV